MSVLCCLYRCIFVAVTSVGIDLTLNTGRLFTSGLYLSKFLLDIPPRWTTSRAGRNVQSLQRVVGFQPVRGKQLVTLSFFHEGHSWHACQEKMCCLWANWRQRQQEWQSDVCGCTAADGWTPNKEIRALSLWGLPPQTCSHSSSSHRKNPIVDAPPLWKSPFPPWHNDCVFAAKYWHRWAQCCLQSIQSVLDSNVLNRRDTFGTVESSAIITSISCV